MRISGIYEERIPEQGREDMEKISPIQGKEEVPFSRSGDKNIGTERTTFRQ